MNSNNFIVNFEFVSNFSKFALLPLVQNGFKKVVHAQDASKLFINLSWRNLVQKILNNKLFSLVLLYLVL